jgi:hypothetical protein
MPIFFWFMVLPTFAFHTGGLAARLTGLSQWIGLTAGGVLCASLCIPIFARVRRNGLIRGSHVLQPAKREDERYRLRLIINDSKPSFDPLDDDAWEPIIIPIRFALPDRKGWAIFAWIIILLALLAAAFWFRVTQLKSGVPFNAQDGWTVAALSSLPFMWLWPAYLRISPGRLDILRYGFLGFGRPRVRTVDLRRARVRYTGVVGGQLLIEPAESPPLALTLMNLRPPIVVRPIFQAARWRGEIVDLPEDALLG